MSYSSYVPFLGQQVGTTKLILISLTEIDHMLSEGQTEELRGTEYEKMIWQISHCFETTQTLSGVLRAYCLPIIKQEQHYFYITRVWQDQLLKPKKLLASVRMAKTNACIWNTSPREASCIKIRNSLDAKLVFNGKCLFAE